MYIDLEGRICFAYGTLPTCNSFLPMTIKPCIFERTSYKPFISHKIPNLCSPLNAFLTKAPLTFIQIGRITYSGRIKYYIMSFHYIDMSQIIVTLSECNTVCNISDLIMYFVKAYKVQVYVIYIVGVCPKLKQYECMCVRVCVFIDMCI